MTPLLRVRQVVNLVILSTPLGLIVGLAGGGRLRRGPRGLVLAENYRSAFPGGTARAVTIGNVVLLRMSRAEAEALPGLIDHESRHATQYACWVGPFGFLPAYFLACAWSWWHTGNVALRNIFEVRAGLADGGYVHDPQRSGPQGV